MTEQTLCDVIETLLKKAASNHDAGEAMKFAQAALNVAHIGSLHVILPRHYTADE